MPPVEALRQSFIKKMIRPSRFFCSLPLCRRRLAIPSFVRASMTKSFVIRGKMLWSSLSNFIVMPMSRCNDGWHDIVQDATLISDQRTFAAWENAFASLDPFQFQSTILLHFQWWISWIFARREVQLRGFLISSGTICMATCCDVRKKGVFLSAIEDFPLVFNGFFAVAIMEVLAYIFLARRPFLTIVRFCPTVQRKHPHFPHIHLKWKID